MARGKTSAIGTTRVAPNGYHYTKVVERGWVLTHWLIMEEHLGRPLTPDESVRFVSDKVKRQLASTGTCDVSGLTLIRKRTASLRARKARLEAKRDQIDAELADINKKLRVD